MAYHFIDRGAYTFGIALIIERCRNTAQFSGFLCNKVVNFLSSHACTDIFCNVVQNGYIDFTAFFDSLYLLRGFYNGVVGDFMPLTFNERDFFIKLLMAFFIFFSASAPARFISSNFSHKNLSFPYELFLLYT